MAENEWESIKPPGNNESDKPKFPDKMFLALGVDLSDGVPNYIYIYHDLLFEKLEANLARDNFHAAR